MDISWETHNRTKSQRRSRAKQQLTWLSAADKQSQSTHICEQLSQHLPDYSTRAVFFPFSYEPNISVFVQELWDNNKTVLVPQVHKDQMRLAIYAPGNIITTGTYGEAIIADPVWYDWDIDICLVPGLVFDIWWNRIGHGKWYYDRFLAENECFRIGICYSPTIVKQLPHEDHDQKVDIILS